MSMTHGQMMWPVSSSHKYPGQQIYLPFSPDTNCQSSPPPVQHTACVTGGRATHTATRAGERGRRAGGRILRKIIFRLYSRNHLIEKYLCITFFY